MSLSEICHDSVRLHLDMLKDVSILLEIIESEINLEDGIMRDRIRVLSKAARSNLEAVIDDLPYQVGMKELR
jgi:hypothetical protein